jgi:hypothetical protein
MASPSLSVLLKVAKVALLMIISHSLFSQQVADTTYRPELPHPAYAPGKGPVLFIDEGHHNFHTKSGRYRAFSDLLERDGYQVLPYEGTFVKKQLKHGKILVISNALNQANVNDWYLPAPSAFTESEINILNQWVKRGGSLFLIADHMPMAGAAEELAASFGFGFNNGFAMDTVNPGPAFFSLEDQTLAKSVITQGREPEENVTQVVSFTGQAFKIPEDATPVLTFGSSFVTLMPDTAWVFDDRTRREGVEGWSQGAFKPYGKGRVVVFGEAAMFTAQLAGPNKIKAGMNSEIAGENYKLLLNIIHWLDGRLD